MNDPIHTPDPAAGPATDVDYKYQIGDKVYIPGHTGDYVGEVVHRYPNLEVACDRYERSFRTILQQPHGKVDGNQPFYYCEVANQTRKPLGVAESSARLKWRKPEPEAEGGEKGNG
jgi:hypothetical protein